MKKDIIIIDDCVTSRLLYSKMLAKLGLDAFCANGFTDAELVLKNNPIKVALVDYMLPGEKNGLEIIDYIHRNIDNNIKCVLCTAYMSEISLEETRGILVYKLLKKPFDIDNLAEVVFSALSDYEINILNKGAMLVQYPISRTTKYASVSEKVLNRIEFINNDYVLDNEWTIDYTQQHGISTEISFDISKTSCFSYTFLDKTSTLSLSKMNIRNILVSLGSKVDISKEIVKSRSLKYNVSTNYQVNMEVLPINDQEMHDGLVLVKYESAPVYQHYTCSIITTCTCCKNTVENFVSFIIPSDRVALRKVYIYENGADIVVFIGYTKGKVTPL